MRNKLNRQLVLALALLTVLWAGRAFALDDPNEKTFELTDRVEESQRKTKLMRITNLIDEQKSVLDDEQQEPKSEILDLVDQLNRMQLPGEKPQQTDEEKILEQMQPVQKEVKAQRPEIAEEISPVRRREAMLNKLLEDPSAVANPLAVADVLYKKGDRHKAGIFYELALQSVNDNKENPDRSWILFQFANCVRFDNPAQAASLYDQLISDYPVCEWIEMARSRRQIVDWFLDDMNVAVLEKYTIHEF